MPLLDACPAADEALSLEPLPCRDFLSRKFAGLMEVTLVGARGLPAADVSLSGWDGAGWVGRRGRRWGLLPRPCCSRWGLLLLLLLVMLVPE